MILVKITNQSIKESGNKGFLKEKETVWRLQISVLIDTNPWIDWDFLSILQIFPSLDNKTKYFRPQHFDDYWITNW